MHRSSAQGVLYRSRQPLMAASALALGQFFRLIKSKLANAVHRGAGDTVQRLIGRKQIVQIAVALCAGHPAGVGLLQKAKLSSAAISLRSVALDTAMSK